MTEQECLDAVHEEGTSAYTLLLEANPKLYIRFQSISESMVKLLADVRVHFPDATYYTASGGFNLLLGNSHSSDGKDQQELSACCGYGVEIDAGDY